MTFDSKILTAEIFVSCFGEANERMRRRGGFSLNICVASLHRFAPGSGVPPPTGVSGGPRARIRLPRGSRSPSLLRPRPRRRVMDRRRRCLLSLDARRHHAGSLVVYLIKKKGKKKNKKTFVTRAPLLLSRP